MRGASLEFATSPSILPVSALSKDEKVLMSDAIPEGSAFAAVELGATIVMLKFDDDVDRP